MGEELLKKYILSDLHIGHKNAQYAVMDQAISYIRQNAKTGDEIWGLGRWHGMARTTPAIGVAALALLTAIILVPSVALATTVNFYQLNGVSFADGSNGYLAGGFSPPCSASDFHSNLWPQ